MSFQIVSTKSAGKFARRFIDLGVKEMGPLSTCFKPKWVAYGQPIGELTQAALPNGKEWLHPQNDR
jgi:hypothetical protein